MQHENDLVATTGLLTGVQETIEGYVLTLQQTNRVFKAILRDESRREGIEPQWTPGSTLKVVGICDVIYENPRPLMGIWNPQDFQILLRSPADVTVLQAAPWWTAQRVNTALALVSGALLLIALGLVAFVRRGAREQARHRAMAEAEFAAILAERNRVAREIHDTLAQGLAATSVQLRLAKKHVLDAPQNLERHIDTAQQLVRDSLEEARNSIWNMRSQILENGTLADALEGILRQMTDGTGVQPEFRCAGKVRRLAPVVEGNVLRIGQEAITNAFKHANAKRLEVEITFGEKQLDLVVKDDGSGFNAEKSTSSGVGFGLVGMQERARALQARLEVKTGPGQGTAIDLEVPLAGGD